MVRFLLFIMKDCERRKVLGSCLFIFCTTANFVHIRRLRQIQSRERERERERVRERERERDRERERGRG